MRSMALWRYKTLLQVYSHGLNKLVTNWIDKEYDDNEQEASETKTEVFAFASRWSGGWEVSKAGRDSQGSRTCACANKHLQSEWHAQVEEGRINVLPWHRPVGVAKTFQ